MIWKLPVAGVALVTFLLISSGCAMNRQPAPMADKTDPFLFVVQDNKEAINLQFEAIRQDNPELAATFALMYASRFDAQLLNPILGPEFGPDDFPCELRPVGPCLPVDWEAEIHAFLTEFQKANWCRDSGGPTKCEIVRVPTPKEACLAAQASHQEAEDILNQTNPPPTEAEKLDADIQKGEAAKVLRDNNCADEFGITT